jgi:tryptophan-rich sensory protein
MAAGWFQSIVAFVLWVVICYAPAVAGVKFLPDDWYRRLNKPPWNPPSWVFGPVWTLLYGSMAVAVWLVWREGGWAAQWAPLSLFLLQLLFNGLWSWLFFGRRNPGAAFADIVLIWVTLAATILAFRHVSVIAAAILLPYLAWVSFASALNFSIWQRNR